jgi:hypothetical protein
MTWVTTLPQVRGRAVKHVMALPVAPRSVRLGRSFFLADVFHARGRIGHEQPRSMPQLKRMLSTAFT